MCPDRTRMSSGRDFFDSLAASARQRAGAVSRCGSGFFGCGAGQGQLFLVEHAQRADVVLLPGLGLAQIVDHHRVLAHPVQAQPLGGQGAC